MQRCAIVTLAVGKEYSDRFEALCRKGWEAYAHRHGFDLVVFKEPLDTSDRARSRSPAWQKCLILSAPETASYDRVIWVDSDILISPLAPSILSGVPEERTGATDEHSFPSPAIRQTILRQIIRISPEEGELSKRFWHAWLDAGTWHAYAGLPEGQKHIVQTGVLVLSRKHHRALLEHVYYTYEDRGSKSFNYEMRPLSHEIQRHGLQHWIDPRFNALVWWMYLHDSMKAPKPVTQEELYRFLIDAYRRSYFLHFAGAGHLMALLAATVS